MLVFLFFGILCLLIIVTLLLTIRLELDKINLSILEEDKKSKFMFEYEIYLGLYLFNKIKILRVMIDKEKLKRVSIKDKINVEQVKKIKNKMSGENELNNIIKKFNIKVSKLNLKLELDTLDVLLTTSIVTSLSIFISLLLSKFIKASKSKEFKYKITPLYTNKNMLNLEINCIINVKIVHIISVIFILIKKRRDDKNERTSNRGTYDYSYE